MSFLQVTSKVTPPSGVSGPPATRWSEELDRGHGGYLLVIAPAVFAGLGWWLDGLLGWAPILMIIGGLYGLFGALYKVISSYRAEMARHETARTSARRDAVAAKVAARSAPEASP